MRVSRRSRCRLRLLPANAAAVVRRGPTALVQRRCVQPRRRLLGGSRLTLKRPATIGRTVDLSGRHLVPAFGEAHNHNIPGTRRAGHHPPLPRTGHLLRDDPGQFAGGARRDPRRCVNHAALRPRGVCEWHLHRAGRTSHCARRAEHRARRYERRPIATAASSIPCHRPTTSIARWWTAVAPQHPDFIKLVLAYRRTASPASHVRHRIGTGSIPRSCRIWCKLAHRHHLRVSAHVESAYDFEVAVKAGVDVIAHLPGFWPDPGAIAAKGTGIYTISEARRASRRSVTSPSLRRLASRCTVSPLRPPATDAGPPRACRPQAAVARDLPPQSRRAGRNGVRIAIGSDQFRSTSDRRSTRDRTGRSHAQSRSSAGPLVGCGRGDPAIDGAVRPRRERPGRFSRARWGSARGLQRHHANHVCGSRTARNWPLPAGDH